MTQHALIGEREPKDDRALQKMRRKKQAKNTALLNEVPELNTSLIEAYQDLDRTTRAAKDLASRIKTAQQQAKVATELWRATELKLVAFEQNMPQQQPLSLPAPTTEALLAPSPNHNNLAHQNVATVEASTLTDSILTIEANTLTDPIQTIDASTTTELVKPMEIASSHP